MIYAKALEILNQNKAQRFNELNSDLYQVLNLLLIEVKEGKLTEDDLRLVLGTIVTKCNSILENLKLFCYATGNKWVMSQLIPKENRDKEIEELKEQIIELQKHCGIYKDKNLTDFNEKVEKIKETNKTFFKYNSE